MCSFFWILYMSSHFGMYHIYSECEIMKTWVFVIILWCVLFALLRPAIFLGRPELQFCFFGQQHWPWFESFAFSCFILPHACMVHRPAWDVGTQNCGIPSLSLFFSLPRLHHSLITSAAVSQLHFSDSATQKDSGFFHQCPHQPGAKCQRNHTNPRPQATEMGSLHHSAALLPALTPHRVCLLLFPLQWLQVVAFCHVQVPLVGTLLSLPEAGSQFSLQNCFYQQGVGNNWSTCYQEWL